MDNTIIQSLRQLCDAWDALLLSRQSLAQERDAAVAERDALTAQVEQLTEQLHACRLNGGEPPLSRIHLDAIDIDAESITYKWIAAGGSDARLSLWPTRGRGLPSLRIDLVGDAGTRRVTLEEMRQAWPGAAPGWEISAMLLARLGDTEHVSDEILETLPPVVDPPVIDPPQRPDTDAKPLPADRVLRSNTTYSGVATPGADYRLAPNATNVVLINSTFDNARLLLTDGNQYRNVRIVNVTFRGFRHRGGGNKHEAPLTATIHTVGLTVEGCTFENSNQYGILLTHPDDLRITGNVFRDLWQGAQIVDIRATAEITDNHLTGLSRMGFEIQGDRYTIRRLLVERNVIHSWRHPHHDAFGLSIVPELTDPGATIVRDNWMQASRTGDWLPGGHKRFGPAIEIGGVEPIVEGNVISAGVHEVDGQLAWRDQFVCGFLISAKDAQIRNNRLHGPTPTWPWLAPQGGKHGRGTYHAYNNTIELDPAKAPQPYTGEAE